jgi:hypothetical protein
MSLATLSIDLIAKLAEFQAGMDKASRIAEKSAAQIEARFERMKAVAVGVGAALGGAISVAGLSQLFRATVDGLDKLNDLADATGATVENLSALEDIAARTGTSVDTVGDALIKLNKSLTTAQPGNEMAAAFKAIGLSAEDLKRLDPAEALRKVALALSGYADDGNKARLVQEIFGKSMREVAPLLNDLARAGGLNAKVTREQAEAAEQFNHQLAAFAKNSEDSKRAIVSDLLPSLNAFIREVNLAKTAYGSLLRAIWDNTGPMTSGSTTERIASAVDEIARIRTTIANADAGRTKPLFSDQRKSLEDDIRLLEKRANFLRAMQAESVTQADYSNEGRPRNRPSIVAPDRRPASLGTGPAPKRFVSNSDDSEAFRNALKAIEQTDVGKIQELEKTLEVLAELQRETRGKVPVAAAMTKLREEVKLLTPEGKAAAEAQKKLIELLAATPTGQMELLRREADLLADAMGQATSSAEMNQLGEALGMTYEKMKQLRGVVKPVADEMSEFAAQAARNIQTSLGDTVLATLEGKFGSIETLWKNMLKRLIAEAAAAELGKYILGPGYGKTGEVGGALGQLFDFLRGLGGAGGQSTRAAIGIDYVPFDGMNAVLHKGERVQTAREARQADRMAATGGGAGGASYTVVVQGDASANTLRLIQAAMAQFEARQLSRAGV